MGKSKGAQRTKGNVRPSSSGRTAELLGSGSKVGFVGFGATKIGQHVSQEGESDIDGMFSMVMKKMTKRDVTTKLKAIQEYKNLVCEKDKDTVLSILPFWPRLYNKLSLDFDRRIREAIQEANAKVIEKVKRDIAPYLRNIAGVWLLSQCDIYAPAASLAKSTFFTTLPTEKQPEALMFCREQIFMYFRENLFEQTPESLAEPNASPEEIENKYILVIAGSLQGLRLFLTTISEENRKTVLETVKGFISVNKFWKHAKYKSPQVRVAWYNLISVLCHDMPEVFEKCEHKLGCTIFVCLSETDSAVISAVWEAALNYVVSFQNCWDSIDVQKVVVPHLWDLLKNGGKGNASLVFPCLLPFLSKLPSSITEEKPDFLISFFDRFIQSLFLDSVKKSTIECNAIVTAYMECLRYVALQHKNESHSEFLKELICVQLTKLLERSFTSEGAHLPVSKFYSLLGNFLILLEQNCRNDPSYLSAVFETILLQFWNFIDVTCCNILEREHSDKRTDLVYLTYFIHCVCEPQNNMHKSKKGKVRFFEDHLEEIDNSTSSLDNLNTINLTKRKHVLKFTVNTCSILCDKLIENFNAHYIKLFLEVLNLAHCPELFQVLLQKRNVSVEDSKDAPRIFFENYILMWMKQLNLSKCLIDDLVAIVFVINSCLEDETALHVLNTVVEIENLLLLNGTLQRSLLEFDQDPIASKWLKSESANSVVTRLLTYVRDSVVFEIGKENSVPFQNAVTFSSSVETFFMSPISREGTVNMNEILSIVKESFAMYLNCDVGIYITNAKAIAFFAHLCKHILHNDEEYWSLPAVKDLMNLLFDCSLLPQLANEEILRATITTLWLSAVKQLPNCMMEFYNDEGFVFEVVEKLHRLLMNPKLHMSTDFGIVQFLRELQTLQKSTLNLRNGENIYIRDVLCKIFPSEKEWSQLKDNLQLNLLPMYLEKKIYYPLPEEVLKFDVSKPIPSYVLVAQFLSDVIVQLLDFGIGGKSLDGLPSSFTAQLPHLIWAFSYCEGCDYLKNEDTDEYKVAIKLQRNCFDIFADFAKDDISKFLTDLCKMNHKGYFEWEMPFQNAIEIAKTFYLEEIHDILRNFFGSEFNDSSSNHLVNQIIIQHTDIETKRDHLHNLLKDFKHESNSLDLHLLSQLCACLCDKNLLTSDSELENEVKIFFKNILDLYSFDEISCENADQLSLVIAILSSIASNWPSMFSSAQWSNVLSHVIASLKYCYTVKEDVPIKPSLLISAHRTCSFACMLLSTFYEESDSSASSQEWRMQLDRLSEPLLLLFFGIADVCDKIKPVTKVVESVLTALSQAIEFLPTDSLLAALLKSLEKCDNLSKLDSAESRPLDLPLQHLLQFLTSNVRPLQLGMHTVLTKSMKLLPALMSEDDQISETDEEIIINKKLLPLIELLKYTSQIVEVMLSDIKIGECCLVLPNTDSYTYTLAYLFAWSEFFEFLDVSETERSSYVKYLEHCGFLKSLLSNLFCLMPENPTSCLRNFNKFNSSQHDLLKAVFIDPPSISLLDPPAAEDIQCIACNIYYNTLQRVPAVVRMWWNNLDKRSSDAVNVFTARNISSILITKEIQAVQDSDLQIPNMSIRTRIATREVVATYTIDGSNIELTIQLPVNYPLGPVAINDSGKIKISKPELRHWLVQLTTFLTYQNGSVLSGLLYWKKNLDKKYEGKEECMICFYILNSSTGKLPEKSCFTCKKKFHSDCIYKWFMTSNNSLCPLCRNFFHT